MTKQSTVTLRLARNENLVFGREALIVMRDTVTLGRGKVDIPIEGRLPDWALLLVNKFGRCQLFPLWDAAGSRLGIDVDHINRQGNVEIRNGQTISFDPDCSWQFRKISHASAVLAATHNSEAVIRANGISLRKAILLQDHCKFGPNQKELETIEVPCEVEIRRTHEGLEFKSQEVSLELAITEQPNHEPHIDLICKFDEVDFRLLMQRLTQKQPYETRHRIAYLSHQREGSGWGMASLASDSDPSNAPKEKRVASAYLA